MFYTNILKVGQQLDLYRKQRHGSLSLICFRLKFKNIWTYIQYYSLYKQLLESGGKAPTFAKQGRLSIVLSSKYYNISNTLHVCNNGIDVVQVKWINYEGGEVQLYTVISVSYTHLDVYKRQQLHLYLKFIIFKSLALVHLHCWFWLIFEFKFLVIMDCEDLFILLYNNFSWFTSIHTTKYFCL